LTRYRKKIMTASRQSGWDRNPFTGRELFF
jgi:hypothetical protein